MLSYDFMTTCFCSHRDEAKQLPKELFKKVASIGWLGACVGAPWPKQAGTNIISGLKPEEFDVFHEMIGTEELSRSGSGGVLWSVTERLALFEQCTELEMLMPVLLCSQGSLRWSLDRSPTGSPVRQSGDGGARRSSVLGG
jgi:hypothetical protein